jgi:hypothetical protein
MSPARRWGQAWPDALAFIVGLAIAALSGWKTADLIWSLWLSSLLVGYSIIVWTIFSRAWGRPAWLAGGVFMLAFFTFHFGMFHGVHSMFLHQFFPLDGVRVSGAPDYLEVFRRYALWVPVALFTERAAFTRPPRSTDTTPIKINAHDALLKPYVNVIRLHLLIFFFAGAHALGLENVAIYAVVYAAYFFPWRLLFPAKKIASQRPTTMSLNK